MQILEQRDHDVLRGVSLLLPLLPPDEEAALLVHGTEARLQCRLAVVGGEETARSSGGDGRVSHGALFGGRAYHLGKGRGVGRSSVTVGDGQTQKVLVMKRLGIAMFRNAAGIR